jgi:hypothetical protein
LRYRLLEGAPIACHQGEVTLAPTPGGCELKWTIRYRPKIPGTSGLVRRAMETMLDETLPRLKALAERH